MNNIFSEINPILIEYFGEKRFQLEISKGGMNNTTCFVGVDEDKYTLRIYRSHNDETKVCYELEVINALNGMDIPISVPQVIASAKGDLFTKTGCGNIAVIFKYIKGKNPTFSRLKDIESFGYACGLLTQALGNLKINKMPAYKPCYEIESAYPECPLDKVLEFCYSPPSNFVEYNEYLERIGKQLIILKEKVSYYRKLPHQIIHGDLNASNVLADNDGKICGILDFEFVSYDLRVMELAVCLSDMIYYTEGEGSKFQRINSLIMGYRRVMNLGDDELFIIPSLLILRRLDVFIHFLYRYWNGIDGIEVLKERILNNMEHFNWLIHNYDEINKAIKE